MGLELLSEQWALVCRETCGLSTPRQSTVLYPSEARRSLWNFPGFARIVPTGTRMRLCTRQSVHLPLATISSTCDPSLLVVAVSSVGVERVHNAKRSGRPVSISALRTCRPYPFGMMESVGRRDGEELRRSVDRWQRHASRALLSRHDSLSH